MSLPPHCSSAKILYCQKNEIELRLQELAVYKAQFNLWCSICRKYSHIAACRTQSFGLSKTYNVTLGARTAPKTRRSSAASVLQQVKCVGDSLNRSMWEVRTEGEIFGQAVSRVKWWFEAFQNEQKDEQCNSDNFPFCDQMYLYKSL